jgi:NAD(P)-dependent dehydrogenase (short-subunit alcohol dehydrogenase family)
VSHVITLFGELNYAVNAAGITGKSIGTAEMDFEEYQRVQRINMEGVWLCERAELKVMLEQEPIDGYGHSQKFDPMIKSGLVGVLSILLLFWALTVLHGRCRMWFRSTRLLD